MDLIFAITVIVILVFSIFWYGVRASSRLLKSALEKDIAAFFRDVADKDDYTLYIPDEQSIWRHGDSELFFSRRREWTSPITVNRTRVLFRYKIDDDKKAIYLWETHMFLSKSSYSFDDFRTISELRSDAERVNSAIDKAKKAAS